MSPHIVRGWRNSAHRLDPEVALGLHEADHFLKGRPFHSSLDEEGSNAPPHLRAIRLWDGLGRVRRAGQRLDSEVARRDDPPWWNTFRWENESARQPGQHGRST